MEETKTKRHKAYTRLFPNAEEGLSAAQVQEQRQRGLLNTPPDRIVKTTGEIVRDNLLTLFNLFNVAIGMAIASVGAYENLLYLTIVFANALIGIVQEIRSRRAVEKLSLISAPKARVIRDGQEADIPVEELVLDDMILLNLGRQVCVDAMVRKGEIEVNEALLTGEADSILKQEGDSLLSGSYVVSGRCYAQVDHVGKDNFAVQITQEASVHKKLESKLLGAMNLIVKFCSYFLIPIGMFMFVRSYFWLDASMRDTVLSTGAAILGMMPKGLVLLTSVSLAVGVVKLARKRTLVQELYCIETLSRVDVLCLDKTGTLTQGEMTVIDMVELPGAKELPFTAEQAIGVVLFAQKDNNATFQALEHAYQKESAYEVEEIVPFSSERKWSATRLKEYGTIVMGAPERILGEKMELEPWLEEVLEEGGRLLLLGYTKSRVERTLPADVLPCAAVILADPLRPDAREILDFFREQGVAIKIISGDSAKTVSGVARQAGLADAEACLDLTALSDEQVQDAAEQHTVFGRVTPLQKRMLIRSMKEAGHTVAMVGDGVNDVLALKDADCSIAMAAGSDATKQISHLVLLDSNFSSLPSVVMEGRRVINNVMRTASLFLVKTIFSFLLSLVNVGFGVPYPFSPVQLSLLGSVAEGIPAFVLTLEPDHARLKGDFLKTVSFRALPTALVIVIIAVVIQTCGPAWGFSPKEISGLILNVCGVAWLFLLLRICWPLNLLRGILVVAMAVLFFGATFFLHELLNIGILAGEALAAFFLLSAGVILLTMLIWTLGRRYLPEHIRDIFY